MSHDEFSDNEDFLSALKTQQGRVPTEPKQAWTDKQEQVVALELKV
jgi:hypothetical protein